MMLFALCTLLVGTVLGTRYRVQVLVPAGMFGLAAVAISAGIKDLSVSSAAIAGLVCVVALQLGYLCGLFTRFVMVVARTTPMRSLRSNTVRL